MMLRANAMGYCILLCAVTGILCYALIILSGYQELHKVQLHLISKITHTNKQAETYYLSVIDQGIINVNQDILDNEIYSKGEIKPWGTFSVLNTSSFFKQDTIKSSLLIGRRGTSNFSLVLPNKGKRLHLSGNSFITGEKKVPSGKLEVSYLSGSRRPNLKKSNRGIFPSESGSFRSDMSKYTINEIVDKVYREYSGLKEKGVFYNSFVSPTVFIKVPSKVDSITLKGNIVLISTDSLTLGSQAKLSDVIVKAAAVNLSSGLKGNFQIEAQRGIYLNRGVELSYPSSLSIMSDQDGLISIGNRSKVIGGIFLSNKTKPKLNQCKLIIDKGAKVIGASFIQGYTDLKGEHIGSLYTDMFYLKTASSVHENYLNDGQISSFDFPDDFVLPSNVQTSNDDEGWRAIKKI